MSVKFGRDQGCEQLARAERSSRLSASQEVAGEVQLLKHALCWVSEELLNLVSPLES